MNILLISLVKDIFRARQSRKPKGTVFFRLPSLALANIAALTPAEDKITVVDEQISPVNYNLDVDLVALSVNTSIAKRAYEIADNFRAKGVQVVFGGIHPSLMPEESLKHADSIVIGDADGIWEKLLKDFKDNKLKKKYINNQSRDLKYLPIPKREIFKGMGYITTNFVEATRGCLYSCKFCSTSPFYHHKHRTRPIENVIEDIKRVNSFPNKLIVFTDDNIIGDKEYARRLFKALIPLHIYWGSQSTVDIGEDEELVKLAAKSGCFGLFIGFESISPDNLKDIGKTHNHIESYKKTIRLLHQNGIGVEGGLMFGFEQDTPRIFKETLTFLKDTNLDSFLSIYLTPIPGTNMYDEFQKQKRLIVDDYSKYDFRHLVFRPSKMSTKEIYDGVSWITKEFYSRKLIAKRFVFKMWDLFVNPSIRRLLVLVALLVFSAASRNRIKAYASDGTFPESFKDI